MRPFYLRLNSLLLTTLILLGFYAISTPPTTGEYLYEEMMFQVESVDHAQTLADRFDVELISVSPQNIALFQVETTDPWDSMLDTGFYYNSDYVIQGPAWNQTDPYLDDQYGLVITKTIDAWTYSIGSPSIVIAIIDTGIDIDHPEFEGRISELSYNVPNDSVGLLAVNDDDGHGTMVAGIIAANKNNGIGIAGITQNTQLLVIKTNEDGSESFKESDIIEGIYYAVDHGADVINLSLGSTYNNPLTEAAIDYATEQGVFIVCASGNNGTEETVYPASYANSISVSAVDALKVLSTYSSYGSYIDLAAPGNSIYSTAVGGGYASASGTSFASPHVAGIIALYLSIDPNASVEEVKARLYGSAEDLGDPGLDIQYGNGLINADALIQSVYHEIAFVMPSSAEIEPIYILEGESPSLSAAPVIEGYLFQGWFYDAEFLIPFDASAVISEDLILYAKYVRSHFLVTFVTSGSPIEAMTVPNGESFVLPAGIKEGSEFIGWFLDSLYSLPYEPLPIENDMVLYAKFEVIEYQASFYWEEELLFQIPFEFGGTITLPEISIMGSTFDGWYLDSGFSELWDGTVPSHDLSLYAKMTKILYTFNFYDYDQSTLYQTLNYYYDENPVFPILDDLPSSSYLNFDFLGWDLSNIYETQINDVYPVIQITFNPEAVTYNPEIDTIILDHEYLYAGINVTDDRLTVVMRNSVDCTTPGRYILYYDVFYGDLFLYTFPRIVNVLPAADEVYITVYKGLTTLFKDQYYWDAGAETNLGTIQVIGSVDVSVPGVYEIIYRVDYQGKIYEKSRYVFVLIQEEPIFIPLAYLEKREDEYDA